MITKKDLFSLKYYIAGLLLVLSFYIYTALVGWAIIDTSGSEREKGGTNHYHASGYYGYYGHSHFYHK